MSRRKRYSAEFKREALRRANEPGVTDVLVAKNWASIRSSCADGARRSSKTATKRSRARGKAATRKSRGSNVSLPRSSRNGIF